MMGLIEVSIMGQWWAHARLYPFGGGDTTMRALIAHPWNNGDWTKTSGYPKPTVKSRGLPRDMSFIGMSETHYVIVDDGESDDERRYVTQKEAEEMEPSRVPGFVLDPSEWCDATWLMLSELKTACQRYKKLRKGPSLELESWHAMMASIQKTHDARIIFWFNR